MTNVREQCHSYVSHLQFSDKAGAQVSITGNISVTERQYLYHVKPYGDKSFHSYATSTKNQ